MNAKPLAAKFSLSVDIPARNVKAYNHEQSLTSATFPDNCFLFFFDRENRKSAINSKTIRKKQFKVQVVSKCKYHLSKGSQGQTIENGKVMPQECCLHFKVSDLTRVYIYIFHSMSFY